MAERIKKQELNFSRRLNYLVSSVLTSVVALALENVIKHFDNIRSFFSSNFINQGKIDSENRYLKDVDRALVLYYNANKFLPDSLAALKLDITNLCAIRTNLIEDDDQDREDFFEQARLLRNFCNHTNEISEETYLEKCNEMRKLIRTCPLIEKKYIDYFIEELNYILENLLIIDKQDLVQRFREFEEKLNLIIKRIERNEAAIWNNRQQMDILASRYEKNEHEIRSHTQHMIDLLTTRYEKNENEIRRQTQHINSIQNRCHNLVNIYFFQILNKFH